VGYPGTPGIHTPEQVVGWRAVVDAVHGAGGLVACQLFHAGRVSHPSLQPGGALPVAPSAVRPAGQAMTATGPRPFPTPRALAAAEIPGIVQAFRHGGACAREAGFDAVELHGANGYLPDQFLRDGTNRRDDAWGGSVARRARFLLEVVDALVGVWGPRRVGVRLSPVQPFNDMRDGDPQTLFEHVARELGRRPLAWLHAQETGADATPFDFDAFRAAFGGPYVANGGYDAARANAAIARGYADLVAFGVPFLANPDLPRRLREGAPLNAPDPTTFYGGDERGYNDYPALP
jgi:N-ethylmaleimide reductase